MYSVPATPEIIIEFLQKKLYLHGYLCLTLQEEMIIRGIINQETHEKIANSLYISQGTSRNISSQLLRRLSRLFKFKITKSNFLILMQKKIDDIAIELDDSKDNTTPKKDTHTYSILLIDDELENLLLLKQILTQRNYIVRMVKSGKIALQFMHKIKPDLILLDILMPDLDGYEVCQVIKKNSQYREIPIIFLSAVSDLGDKVKAFNLGACDYVTKPFEAVEVLARVSYQIKLQSQQQQLQAEIDFHRKTIEALSESRSILASILNNTPYGIAALAAIRHHQNGEVIDFKFIVVNPEFAEIFESSFLQIQNYPSCTPFFQEQSLDWLPQLVNVVTNGKTFEQISHVGNQTVEVRGIKLGDGVNLILNPLVHNSSLSSIDQALNRSINA